MLSTAPTRKPWAVWFMVRPSTLPYLARVCKIWVILPAAPSPIKSLSLGKTKAWLHSHVGANSNVIRWAAIMSIMSVINPCELGPKSIHPNFEVFVSHQSAKSSEEPLTAKRVWFSHGVLLSIELIIVIRFQVSHKPRLRVTGLEPFQNDISNSRKVLGLWYRLQMSIEVLAFSLDFVSHKKGCKLSKNIFHFWNLALSIIELSLKVSWEMEGILVWLVKISKHTLYPTFKIKNDEICEGPPSWISSSSRSPWATSSSSLASSSVLAASILCTLTMKGWWWSSRFVRCNARAARREPMNGRSFCLTYWL